MFLEEIGYLLLSAVKMVIPPEESLVALGDSFPWVEKQPQPELANLP